jgi:membrane fusion protein, multidrug efflux system
MILYAFNGCNHVRNVRTLKKNLYGFKWFRKQKINMKTLYILTISLWLIGCQKEAKHENDIPKEGIVPIRVAQVIQSNSNEAIPTSGLIASATEARLSFKTGGVIQKIYVKEGDRIAKGQLLATLNLTEINAQALQAAEGLSKTERDLKRVQNLYRDSVATLEQVQNLTTALNVAKNNVAIAEYNKGFSQIRATNSGVVVKKLMNDGELAGPGMPVLYITSTASQDWVMRVGISDKDWSRLREGNRAEVRLDAFPNQVFTATISNLSVVPDLNSGQYQAELRLQGIDPRKMATGLFGKASLYPNASTTQRFTTIPIDAIVEGNGNDAFVFVPNGDRAKRMPVKIAYLSADKAYIASGLEGIKEVITDGGAFLTEGVKVKLGKSEK